MCGTDKVSFLLTPVDFGHRHKLLADRFLSQGYEVKCLKNSFEMNGIRPMAPVLNRGPLEGI